MRKFILLAIMAVVAVISVNAQDVKSMVKMMKNDNSAIKGLIDQKVSKSAKAKAKEYKKAKYTTMGGDDLEHQVFELERLEKMPMMDGEEGATYRYIVQSSSAVAGTFSAARGAAVADAKSQIAGLLETKIAAAIELKLGADMESKASNTTLDKFNQRGKQIVENSLIMMQNPLTMRRELKGNQVEVMVGIAYDKKVFGKKLKEILKKQLEDEGDEALNDIVDEALNNIKNN